MIWLIGMMTANALTFIHILLAIAVAAVLFRFLSGRRLKEHRS